MFGELYRLRDRDALLREFDMYEACGEGFPEPTEYVRRMLAVTSRTERGEAWTYIYNWPVIGLPRIESGRFLEQLTRDREHVPVHRAHESTSRST